MSRAGESESDADVDALLAMQNQVVARSDMGTAFYLFSHQAGGHKPFLRSALGEVCKPAIPLELQFYQALDTRFPQLKPFVPPFVGVITVDLHPLAPPPPPPPTPTSTTETTAAAALEQADEDANDGYGEIDTATMPDEPRADTGVADGEVMLRALQLHSPISNPTTGTTAPTTTPSPGGKKRRLDETRRAGESSTPSPSTSPCGPTRSLISTASYSAKLWKKERSKADALGRVGNGSLPQQASSSQRGATATTREYLVLGDLTRAYARPCVLDVKMGTRQHGADAPPAKAKSHSAKCAATTSLELGLRICGMQVYDQVEQRYVLWDKHWGRQLTKRDIEPALTTYLSNGRGLHRASLRALRDKLCALERVVRRTAGVRFWGASLLLIYEGDLSRAPRREDLHLIDFAHCQMSDALEAPDDGLLLGLTNLIEFLSNILQRHEQDDEDGDGQDDHEVEDQGAA